MSRFCNDMLNVIMPNVIMLRVGFAECCYSEYRTAECHYTECRGAEMATGCSV